MSSDSENPSRLQHYVPEFLLRKWESKKEGGQNGVSAVYWDGRQNRLKTSHLGAKAFCRDYDLWSLPSEPEIDRIEKVFRDIDTRAAKAFERLVSGMACKGGDTDTLVIFLNSLEVRRPATVRTLKEGGPEHFLAEAEKDPRIRQAAADTGLTIAQLYESLAGHSLAERFTQSIQTMTEKSKFFEDVRRLSMAVVRIPMGFPNLLLGDRPLVRLGATDAPDTLWLLPVRPRHLFVAAANPREIDRLQRVDPYQLVTTVNQASVAQCDKFVFNVPGLRPPWLANSMRDRHDAGSPDWTALRSSALFGEMLRTRRQ